MNSISSDNHSPSKVWLDWINQIQFLNEIRPEFIRMLAGFGYYLGAPIEQDIWRTNRYKQGDLSVKLVEDFKSIIGDDVTLLLSELDPKKEVFSIPFETDGGKTIWVNTDIVRMQVDAANIFRFGLGRVNTVCEIGGGYGQLALGFVSNNPKTSYTIIDFELVTDVVFKWVSHLKIDVPIFKYRNLEDYLNNYQKSGIHLLPNNLVDFSNKLTFDLGININSFCEMTESQVINYLRCLNVTHFYSNNRDRQANNEQLLSLTDIFRNECDVLSPNPEEYDSGQFKKKVYVIGRSEPFVDLDIDKILGIQGVEMPALGVGVSKT